ncbi:MAG: class I SAM-dependent methyltransferase family protein [Promethearchaeia archaeon]
MKLKNNEVFFVKIAKEKAQKFMKLIKKNYSKKIILNKKYKIVEDNHNVFFPLKISPEKINELMKVIKPFLDFEIIKLKAEERENYEHRTLEEVLKGQISKNYYNLIPHSYDIIGEIAIIEFRNEEKMKKKRKIKKKIANAIIQVNKNVNSVYEKKSKVRGTFRLRKMEYLAGLKRTETLHKENDCLFNLDINRTFFSPRLNHERLLVSKSNFEKGERIADLFAGVGTFSIQIAKLHDVKIYAFDINPFAYKYLKENIEINNLKGTITPFNLDIRNLINPHNQIEIQLRNKIDRIIMNFPEDSLRFLDVACNLIKEEGGIIHNYQFSEKPNSIRKAIAKFRNKIESYDFIIKEIKRSDIIKSYSPKSDMIVIDAFIQKLNQS